MRLKLKHEPKYEERRTVIKFAWLPTFVTHFCEAKKYILWMEYYNEKQSYSSRFHWVSGDPVYKWRTIEKYIP